MDTLLRLALLLIAAFFAVLGLAIMVTPGLASEIFAVSPDGILGLSTLRGDLGGIFLCGGALAGLGLRDPGAAWLPALALLVGAIALGRLIGLMIDGFDTRAVSNIAVEVLIVVVALSARKRLATR